MVGLLLTDASLAEHATITYPAPDLSNPRFRQNVNRLA
jgi:hypothetical protein